MISLATSHGGQNWRCERIDVGSVQRFLMMDNGLYEDLSLKGVFGGFFPSCLLISLNYRVLENGVYSRMHEYLAEVCTSPSVSTKCWYTSINILQHPADAIQK